MEPMPQKRRRQAVVVVHGIGEQPENITAQILANLVVDETDAAFSRPLVDGPTADMRLFNIGWDSPEVRGMRDLQKDNDEAVTARYAHTDIVEGYWAYRYRDTTWGHLASWITPILFTSSELVPDRLLAEGGARRVARRIGTALVALGVFLSAIGLLTNTIEQRGNKLDIIGSWSTIVFYASIAAVAVAIASLIFVVQQHVRPAPDRYWGLVVTQVLRVLLGAVATLLAVLLVSAAVWSFIVTFEPNGVLWLWLGGLSTISGILLAFFGADIVTLMRLVTVAVLALSVGLFYMAVSSIVTGAENPITSIAAFAASLALPVLAAVVGKNVLNSMGDAARYLNRIPSNTEQNDLVADPVTKLLARLNTEKDSYGRFKYERIIVVGHSLGSVIAYDAIRRYWDIQYSRMVIAENSPDSNHDADCECLKRAQALTHVEALGLQIADFETSLGTETELSPTATSDYLELLGSYRSAQRSLSNHLADDGSCANCDPCIAIDAQHLEDHPEEPDAGIQERSSHDAFPHHKHATRWAISDLVTIGSPMANTDYLTGSWKRVTLFGARPTTSVGAETDSSEVAEFVRQRWKRAFPICPPTRQGGSEQAMSSEILDFHYRPTGLRRMHQASVFASTKWTNLYFNNDIVGGPVGPLFGRGIIDIELDGPDPTPAAALLAYSHSTYWKKPEGKVATVLKPGYESSRAVLRMIIRQTPLTPLVTPDGFSPIRSNDITFSPTEDDPTGDDVARHQVRFDGTGALKQAQSDGFQRLAARVVITILGGGREVGVERVRQLVPPADDSRGSQDEEAAIPT